MLFILSFKSRILRNWLGYLIFWQLFLRFSEARGVLSCASGSHSCHFLNPLEIWIFLYSLSHLDLTGVWQKPRIMAPNLLFNCL